METDNKRRVTPRNIKNGWEKRNEDGNRIKRNKVSIPKESRLLNKIDRGRQTTDYDVDKGQKLKKNHCNRNKKTEHEWLKENSQVKILKERKKLRGN